MLKGEDKILILYKNMTPDQLARDYLENALADFKATFPPPYNYPSDEGFVYFTLNEALNRLEQLRKNFKGPLPFWPATKPWVVPKADLF